MKSMEALGNLLVGRLIFPATNSLLNRRGILSSYAELCRAEHYSEEVLRENQKVKLVRLLEYANQWIPYYQRLFKKNDFSPSDIRDLKDLSIVPALGREDVREKHQEMVDLRLCESIDRAKSSRRRPGAPMFLGRFRRHKLIYNTTSGSTGSPTIFFEDGSRSAINWAQELRLKSWFGLPPGIREARFGETAGFRSRSITRRLRQALWHQMILPGKNLSDEVLADSLEAIRAFKPICLFGITSALTGLAQFIQKKEIDISAYRPQLVITWAAPLLQHEERILSEIFHCPVSNIYGSREVGHIAMRCPMGFYHLNQESMVVEIEPQGGAGSKEGAGEILVTPLDLSPMPFIRYRIGDIGTMPIGRCSCGRSLQLFSEVLGRSGELYQLKNGRMLSPNFWSHIFREDELVYAVKRFQVVYKRDHHICIRVSPSDGFTPMSETYLKQKLFSILGPEISVEVEQIPEIRPLPSGKFQLVINESDSQRDTD